MIKQILVKIFLMILTVQYAFGQDSLIATPYYINPRSDSQHIDLSDNWKLSYTDKPINTLKTLPKGDWLNVSYPTSVQWALYYAGKLPYPYKGLNAKKYEWVEQKVWYYKKIFNVSEDLKGNYIYLCFDGIDYFTRIWVNGKYIGSHQGMFGGPIIEVSKELNYGGSNKIIIEVKSANYGKAQAYKPRDPGKIIKPWEFTGGSGAEPFFSVGMWRGARLEIVPKVHMAMPYLVTNNVKNGIAELTLKAQVYINDNTLDYKMHPWGGSWGNTMYYDKSEYIPFKEPIALEVDVNMGERRLISKRFNLDLFEGRNWIKKKFHIKNPKLWWPNGLGDQPLYNIHLKLIYKNKLTDEISFKYGIRTVNNKFTPGPKYSNVWYPWQFVVNGKKFFVKGVNWMPADVLLDLPKEKYRWILGLAKDAGIQMVRIWGAGLLETNDFYDICDSLGIMVWQDYPIANYSTDQWPLNIWESQVIQNILRLRNHTSLVTYCGGNEFNPYGNGNTAAVGIIERNLRIFDPSRLFTRTSPDGGSIHTYPDMDPAWYSKLYKWVPNISETGMHSITDPQDLREVIDSNELTDLGNMYSKEFAKSHPEFIEHFVEYSPSRVPRMLSRASHIGNMVSPSLESISEATQIGAGEFYQILSEKIQSNYPVTAGLLPWVFKRPWPVVAAIHLVDGFGQPDAPYYFLKRTYENVHIMLDIERSLWRPGEAFPVNIKVLNLSKGSPVTKANVKVQIFNQQFNLMYSKEKKVEINNNPSVAEVGFKDFNIPSQFHSQYFFVVVKLKNKKGKIISQSVYWPRTIPQMEDQKFYQKYTTAPTPWPTLKNGPWLKPIVGKTNTKLKLKILNNKAINNKISEVKIQVTNMGKKPSFMTELNITGVKRSFVASDNYFLLAPGKTRNIVLKIHWREPDHKSILILNSWNAHSETAKLH